MKVLYLYYQNETITIKTKEMATTQHEAFIKYPEQVNSLMVHITSNNLDISTQEKFTEAMKSWYITQRKMDKKLSEMPTSVLIKMLTYKGFLT